VAVSAIPVLAVTMLPAWEMIARLVLAAVLGSVVGFERERLAWAAGLRTHMLVSLGSCLFLIVSAYGFNDVLTDHITLDPSRVAAQVVSGIGFLGAGSIIFRNEAVKGLTTAASVWAVAAVGLATGAGLYVAAVGTTVIMLIILAGLKPLQERQRTSDVGFEISLTSEPGALGVEQVNQALGARSRKLKQLIIQRGDKADELTIVLARLSARQVHEIEQRLTGIAGVISLTTKA
jgi:putative Mg2+ transporter-C (MgtC) family protein